MDFVIGYEVKRSGRIYPCPVCESLTGQYPKDFQFVGWHPSCRCYVIPILQTDDEYWNKDFSRQVSESPDNFKEWLESNKERISAADQRGTLPYFLKDNRAFWDENTK